MTCPVCEHVQEDGDACDECGRPLAPPRAVEAPVTLVEGLEPTGAARAAIPTAEPLGELEPTSLPGAGEVGAEDVSGWIERTPVAEEDPYAPIVAPTLTPPLVCRYCRTPTAPGEAFCSGCGMRVLVYQGQPPEPEAPALRRCRACGTPGAGPRCPACGERLPVEEP